jgi:PAS domain S-box-containing protein
MDDRDKVKQQLIDHLEQRCEERTAELARANESLEVYRRFVEASGEGFGMSDLEGKVVYVNPAMCRMMGELKPEEVIGKNVSDFYTADYIRKRKNEIIPTLLRGEVWQSDETFVTQQGKRIEGQHTMVLIRDEKGNPFRVAVVVTDITERKRAEEALRHSEERLHTICNSAHDAVVMIDGGGNAVFWNPAAERMFGYTADEMKGRNVHEILVPECYKEQAAHGFAEFTKSGQGPIIDNVLELTALRKGGTEFPIEISVAAFRIHEQWFAAGIVRDISQRKRAEAALREKNRALKHLMLSSDRERQLIAYEIHDGLAQELAGAMMQFESYDARKDSDRAGAMAAFEAGMSMLRQSHVEARRLIAGVRPPILDEWGVVEAVRHLVNELGHAEGPRISFRSNVYFRRLVPPLENGIYRICQAALANACKYSKSDRVRVSLRQTGNRVRIEIRDWGIGFDRTAAEGLHFGLEGIRQRARLLGGKCSIHSQAGTGTRVIVQLPVVEKEEP